MSPRLRSLPIACAVLALSACASGPKPIRGEFSTLSPEQASQQGTPGASVRWGGSLISVEPEASRTCFTVLSRPLRSDGKPQLKREVTDGRFIACRSGFYDPALFAEGRDVTFTGRISGFEPRAIGGYSFNYRSRLPVGRARGTHRPPLCLSLPLALLESVVAAVLVSGGPR